MESKQESIDKECVDDNTEEREHTDIVDKCTKDVIEPNISNKKSKRKRVSPATETVISDAASRGSSCTPTSRTNTPSTQALVSYSRVGKIYNNVY